MGKNRTLFQLPLRPVAPIKVLGAYDNFFREHLLEAMRQDRQRYDVGLPTYHANLVRIVSDYAGTIVNVDELSLKDLGNFLKGIRSQTPRIKVLDAYIQIVNADARAGFFADTYIENVGTVVSNYLKSPVLTEYERELNMKRVVGAYQAEPVGMAVHRDPVRYLVATRPASSGFILLYNFNGPRPGMSDVDQLQLRTGVCVPQPTSFLFLMKDYLHRRRYVGSAHFTIDRFAERDNIPTLSVSALVARERNYDAHAGGYEESFHDWVGSDRETHRLYKRIFDAKTNTYLKNIVESFAGVL